MRPMKKPVRKIEWTTVEMVTDCRIVKVKVVLENNLSYLESEKCY